MFRFTIRDVLTRVAEALVVVAIVAVVGAMLVYVSRESRKSAEEGAKAYQTSRPT